MLRRTVLAASLLAAGSTLAASGQIPIDPAGQLRAVLPVEVAELVLQKIAEARAQQLPAGVLEDRALELAAKGAAPADILREIELRHAELAAAREALRHGGRESPTDEEIDAGATALGRGVGGAAVSELAKSAPSERSVAVPLFVIASLVNRGLPADNAVAAVQVWLQRHATDTELQELSRNLHRPQIARPILTGRVERPASLPGRRDYGGRPGALGRPRGQ